ncbi:LADA_0B10352g1_1 [Lachancea dasiensis]|uniref:Alpha-1,3-glucosyltransferase n=1 Tax=Lachancea dasiensis TaxID=1072105 RepID=A0A1G4IV73_9SACH|nr:LADA_0B10352g1_1 [Lachancea dasiensis]
MVSGVKSAKESFFASPLYDFLSPFRPVANQYYAEYVIVIFALVIRCAVGLGSFSGEGVSPLFGDFEAQRHWMELTTNIPISQWYWFDLQYWGLDYPPLTAYHSLLLGKLGSLFNPEWYALGSSRGLELPALKAYMRFTVILSEAALYIPGVIYFTKWFGIKRRQSPIGTYIAAAAILFQPSLILIDHGHFQYNSVMLGLTVYAINNLLDGFHGPAAVCFVLSLTFKQMSLYYSPVFFAYLLSRSLFSPSFNVSRFISVALHTLISFAVLFFPLYKFGGLKNVLQSIHRVFPFARGIFEDKVANFWCVSNVFFKYAENYSQIQLQKLSIAATGAGFLPAFLLIFLYPKKHMLPFALAACSMAFFLFSFQVHEKSILVPLLPITLLYCSTNWNVLSMVSWINNVALFTLWPLLKKDNLTIQYVVMLILSNWLIGNFSFCTPRFLPHFLTPGPSVSDVGDSYRRRSLLPESVIWKLIIITSYLAMGLIHCLDVFVEPPSTLPDLWVLMNCALGFSCFALFWLWNNYKLFTLRNKSFEDF